MANKKMDDWLLSEKDTILYIISLFPNMLIKLKFYISGMI